MGTALDLIISNEGKHREGKEDPGCRIWRGSGSSCDSCAQPSQGKRSPSNDSVPTRLLQLADLRALN